ncbi:hypothetical protein ABPG74_001303 [Tetrahymena malaccensis]
MLGNLKGGYSDLWKAIIRPPRDEYTIEELGPTEFKISGVRVKRTDIDIKNKQGLTLKCSHFEPIKRPCQELPCVIYLHGNSSSRMESLNCLKVLLPQNITLFSFDFAGCGLSDGEYISLGWYEREDVDTIVNHLRSSGTVSTIGLWGRSMGAVTALMHADRDPSIAGLVLDSAFSSLRQLAEDLCKQYTKIPKFVMSAAMAMIKSTISSKAKFDINDLNPLKNHVSKAFIPALFVAAKDDNFISPEHTKALHKEYAGDKNLIMVEGDHNSQRPQFMLDSVGIFFYNTLQVEFLVPQQNSKQKQESGSNIPEFDNYNMNSRKIGNHGDVQHALYQIDDNDEEFEQQMKKALEESLKAPLSKDSKQDQQQTNLNKQFDLLSLDKPEFEQLQKPGINSSDIKDHVDYPNENIDLLDMNQFDGNDFTSNNTNQNNIQDINQQQQNQQAAQQQNQVNKMNSNNNINNANNNDKQNNLAEYFSEY